MLKNFSIYVYALLDLGSTLSFVTPYFSVKFGFISEQLLEPFSIFTPIGELVMVEHIYIGVALSQSFTMIPQLIW